MGYGFVVSVLLLAEPRIPSECLHRLTARFFINLRAIAYYQRESDFENRAPPFEPPPVHTRPLHKRFGRFLTNKSVRLGMDKTVYSSGTNPNDGNMEHAEIIDLAVLGSQAHQQRR